MFCSLSRLSQRAWLLKLLAVELHAGDVSSSKHRDACQTILSHLFGQGITEIGGSLAISPFSLQDTSENAAVRTVSKSKVLMVIICFMVPLLLWTSHMHILDFILFYYMLNALLSL